MIPCIGDTVRLREEFVDEIKKKRSYPYWIQELDRKSLRVIAKTEQDKENFTVVTLTVISCEHCKHHSNIDEYIKQRYARQISIKRPDGEIWEPKFLSESVFESANDPNHENSDNSDPNRCSACGEVGKTHKMACVCPNCGKVIWGC